MNIGEKIRAAREISGLTQMQAAERLLVSRQTVSNWENGKSLPDICSVVRMSELYGVSLDELLKGDREMLDKMERDAKVQKAEKRVMRFSLIAILLGAVLLVLGNFFDGNPVMDFACAALPWVLLGFSILLSLLQANE